MAIDASSQGGAMVRVDTAQSVVLVATTTAKLMNMRGQDMPGRQARYGLRAGHEVSA